MYTLDLRRMRVVLEVARAEAITTAAHALGLTQSAVSRTVAEVEDALDQRLFERLPRGIRLTEAGACFVGRAKRIVAEVEDMVAEVSATRNRVTGRLRVGVAASGNHAVDALVAFARDYPEVAIETLHASDQVLCPRLLHGELDLIIGSSSYLKRWQELEVTPLTPLRFACLLRGDHPLANVDAPSEADVLAYPLILPESVEPTYSDIALRYAENGLPALKPHYVTNNWELIKRLLRNTDAFFPLMYPDDSFGGLERRYLVLRDVVHIPTHFISVAHVPGRTRSRTVDIFEQTLRAAFAPAESEAAA